VYYTDIMKLVHMHELIELLRLSAIL